MWANGCRIGGFRFKGFIFRHFGLLDYFFTMFMPLYLCFQNMASTIQCILSTTPLCIYFESIIFETWYWCLSFHCFEVEEAKVSVVTPIDTNDDDIDDDDNVTLKTTSLQLQSLCSMPGHMCGSSTKHQSMMTMSCILTVLSIFSILL